MTNDSSHSSTPIHSRPAGAAGTLLAREELLGAILNTALDGFFISDESGRILEVNDTYCAISGYSRGELLALRIQDLEARESTGGFARHHESIRARGCDRFESCHRRKDGSLVPLEVSVRYLSVEGGCWVSFLRDMTERQQAEASLRQSQADLNRAQAVAGIGSWHLDVARNSFNLSSQIYSILGQATTVTPELNAFFDLVLPEDQSRVMQSWQAIMTGLPTDVECRVHVNGAVKWIRGRTQPELDASGRIVLVTGTVQDITATKQATAALEQKQAVLSSFFRASPVGMGLLQNRVLFEINERLCQITGYDREELIGRDTGIFYLTPEDYVRVGAQIYDAAHRDGVGTVETHIRRKNGEVRDVLINLSFLDPAGGTGAAAVIVTDITEQKQSEARYVRAQRLQCVGTLASGVAHDLNNILSPILLGIELLNDDITDERNRAVLKIIATSAARGADTVRQLLTVARENHSAKGVIQPRHILKEVLQLIRQTFPKNIQVSSHWDATPQTIIADPSQLHQVLLNLCVNARDAMPEGGALTLAQSSQVLDAASAGRHDKARPGPYVTLEVSDTGAGIPPENLSRIFEPFFTTKSPEKGTGLGLATVQQIVEAHEGFVLVTSRVGQGTTFTVYLPACAPAIGSAADDFAPAALPPAGQGAGVLVVDDEPAILQLAQHCLLQHGYNAFVAGSAPEAVELFMRHRGQIVAVLTDLMMPFGDGKSLIARLRELTPEIRIIAMSGSATTAARHDILNRGAAGFLAKPFSPGQLLKLLDQCLQNRE